MYRYRWIQSTYLFFLASFAATLSTTTEKVTLISQTDSLSINFEQMKWEGIALAAVFLGKCFLQNNQQKRVEMVSTNVLWTDLQSFSVEWNHPTLCVWLRREGWQMPNTEQLLYQTEKAPVGGFLWKHCS